MPAIQHPNVFTSAEMSTAINKLPVVSTRLSPLFERISVSTTNVALDLRMGKIILIGDQERGTSPKDIGGKTSKRVAKIIPTNHLPQTATVRPEDIQDVRGFGTIEPVGVATVINDKMMALKRNLAMTLEYHRLGAIKGKVLDADGSTILHDIFDYFGATKAIETIKFPSTNVDVNTVLQQINKAVRRVEAGMGGNPFGRIECLIGADAYDLLTTHELVARYFEDWLARRDNFGENDYRKKGFPYGGVVFYEASQVVGGNVQVASDKGHMYPVGAGIFQTYHGPADWMETVNTQGLEFYARMDELERSRGYSIEVQSNPLTLCTFPEALVELTFQ